MNGHTMCATRVGESWSSTSAPDNEDIAGTGAIAGSNAAGRQYVM
jgi:hypothetical protein